VCGARHETRQEQEHHRRQRDAERGHSGGGGALAETAQIVANQNQMKRSSSVEIRAEALTEGQRSSQLARKASFNLRLPEWDRDGITLLGLPAGGAIPELREDFQNN